jgi:hypothetical protein
VSAGGGGLPVGTIVAWPVAANPADAASWLECNGQSTSGYPELAAVVGANVPDLRGRCLRGLGGHSAALGIRQNDNLSGSKEFKVTLDVEEKEAGLGEQVLATWTDSVEGGHIYERTGKPYKVLITKRRDALVYNSPWLPVSGKTSISSRFDTGSPETRPVNMAVRYLIRARP